LKLRVAVRWIQVDVEERNPTGPGAVGLDDPGDSIAALGIE